MARFGVLVFPGSNCDSDCYEAVRYLGAEAEYIWHHDVDLKGVDAVILPGGFSYGDYLRCGAVARFSEVMEPVSRFAAAGGLVIGICNGFQILLEAGLLPGAMLRNTGLKFICRHVQLRVEDIDNPFTRMCTVGQVLNIPIAHNDGNYFADEETLKGMDAGGQILLRYCDADGKVKPAANPNGAVQNIAGICNRKKNVFGLMPHPERATDPILGSSDGALILESMIAECMETARG